MNEKEFLNKITNDAINSAIEIHKFLGPGLLESCYETCLSFELSNKGLNIERQKPLPVVYKNIKMECGYRMDLLVENSVVIEIKSVESLLPIHTAQLLSYLKLSGCKVGLLINFNVKILKDGVVRLVNNFPD